jgi:hypothetical protein
VNADIVSTVVNPVPRMAGLKKGIGDVVDAASPDEVRCWFVVEVPQHWVRSDRFRL